MANAQLLQAIIRKLTGGAKKSVDPDTAQFGPLNSPNAPRTLPGNRANTNHPDFDPGDFEGSPTQPLNPEDRVGGFNNAEPAQPLHPQRLSELDNAPSRADNPFSPNAGTESDVKLNMLSSTIEDQAKKSGVQSVDKNLIKLMEEAQPGAGRELMQRLHMREFNPLQDSDEIPF